MAEGARAGSSSLRALKAHDLLGLLRQATQQVFASMVVSFRQATLTPQGGDDRIGFEDDSGHSTHAEIDLEAEVSFRGERNGAVVVRCNATGAFDIARGLLMLSRHEVLAIEEVEDALGECANMVGGVLMRTALDVHGRFELGLPVVRHGGSRARRGADRSQLVYQSADGVVSIELWLESVEG